MRILYVSSAKTFGGGERHLVDLSREMASRGHEIFVALRPTNQWQSRLDFLPPENFLHVSIRNSFGMFSAKRIARFIEKNKIEILHAHVARDYLAASIACRVVGNAKLVLTRHVMFPLKPFHRFALRNVDAAIGVSSAVKVQLERVFPAEKVMLIPNGINAVKKNAEEKKIQAEEFRRFHSIPAESPLVVTIGELLVLKGQRDFILAANEIVKRHPECRFVIAGKDNSIDQKFRRELKRLVKVLGHEDRFIWLDWLDDISPLLNAADIFVSPSHSESFGLAILDAMAAGIPVVATATDGAKELLRETDALTPVKDPLALANKISEFLDDADIRSSLGAHLYKLAIENYGLAAMADATEAVYKKVCPAKAVTADMNALP
ncbi:MAG: glycosyltransferase family 4 protein [Chloracidobacterium sp.]|nr:glycosyltransferase family 4 protein [Chloracidobacterium sp.]